MSLPVLKASIASSRPSLHKPSLHHRVREGNGQHRLKPTEQWSEQHRERERERERVRNTKQRHWGQSEAEPGVEGRREIQNDGAGEHERDANATHRSCPLLWLSSITLPVFSPSPRLSSWPFGSVTPVSAAISQPGPVTLLPGPRAAPHRRVGCRQRSLNLTPLL